MLTDEMKAALTAAGLKSDAVWKHQQSGKWIVYHWACEKAAAHLGISFDAPTVVEANAEKKLAVVVVTGRHGEKSEWSFGEAAPYNTKQTYPFAMAEKRAKDRVILKLIGLHGLAYGETEAEDFKGPDPAEAKANEIADLMAKATSPKQLAGIWTSNQTHVAAMPDNIRQHLIKQKDDFKSAFNMEAA